jgi:hypothetical protein
MTTSLPVALLVAAFVPLLLWTTSLRRQSRLLTVAFLTRLREVAPSEATREYDVPFLSLTFRAYARSAELPTPVDDQLASLSGQLRALHGKRLLSIVAGVVLSCAMLMLTLF